MPNAPMAPMNPDPADDESDPELFVMQDFVPAPNLTKPRIQILRASPFPSTPPPPRSDRLGPHQPRNTPAAPPPHIGRRPRPPETREIFGPYSGNMASASTLRILRSRALAKRRAGFIAVS
ncbi:hypothetical protein CSPX01_01986 [Colletotrichum filicis]|nr:hypothetical protein CSPX01_01986 [Colletotrichum filicis]